MEKIDKLSLWMESMKGAISFYKRNPYLKRKDCEYNWQYYENSYHKSVYEKFKNYFKELIGYLPNMKWVNDNWKNLFTARELLSGRISQEKFDLYILMRLFGFRKIYYKRQYFDDLFLINDRRPFNSDLTDSTYLGNKLEIFTLTNKVSGYSFDLISSYEYIDFVNRYRQYFPTFEEVNLYPSQGDVVFDCGACIGDSSVLMASFLGIEGVVHSFDPVPYHHNYLAAQEMLNGKFNLKRCLKAVGNKCQLGNVDSSFARIEPGGLNVSTFDLTTIDEYCLENDIKKLDYLKMDIEGFELEAIEGAINSIKRFRPKLAICAYHKREDLLKIPEKVLSIDSSYKIYFDLHTPTTDEAVLYFI